MAIKLYSFYITYFSDLQSPGTFVSDQNRNLSAVQPGRQDGIVIGAFEAMCALYDTLDYIEKVEGNLNYIQTKFEVMKSITLTGNGLVNTVIKYSNTTPEWAYIYPNYNNDWSRLNTTYNASNPNAGGDYVYVGHLLQVAFFLSRAVERGFNKTWLVTVSDLKNFYLNSSAFCHLNGSINYAHLNEQGQPLDFGETSWWLYAEAARFFLHDYVIHNCVECLNYFNLVSNVIDKYWIDPKYGGWYPTIDVWTYQPLDTRKGENWHVGYHEMGFYSEILRLSTFQGKKKEEDSFESPWILHPALFVVLIFVLLMSLLYRST